MKKIIPLNGILTLIKGGIGAVCGTVDIEDEFEKEKIYFSEPNTAIKKDYVMIDLSEVTSSTCKSLTHILFNAKKGNTFPSDAQVDDGQVTLSDYVEKEILKPIRYSQETYILSICPTNIINEPKERKLYFDIIEYPEQSFSFRIGTGLKYKEQNKYLLINLSPVQYCPNENTLLCSGNRYD